MTVKTPQLQNHSNYQIDSPGKIPSFLVWLEKVHLTTFTLKMSAIFSDLFYYSCVYLKKNCEMSLIIRIFFPVICSLIHKMLV
jgi:hypothetical protein